MAQQLEALTALSETWVWFPASTWWLTLTCNNRPRGLHPILVSWTSCHMWCTYMHANIHTHTTKK